MPRVIRSLASLSAVALLSACAPTILKARVEKVRRVAIIGYEAHVDYPDSGGLSVRTESGRTAERAADVYDRLGAKLAEELHWEVLPLKTVASNPAYVATYKKHSWGGIGHLMEGVSSDFLCPDILWGSLADGLGAEEKQDLIKALGVDAVVVAVIGISPGSSSSIGPAGWVSYNSTLQFYTYDLDAKSPIWKDPRAVGKSKDEAREVSILGITLTTGEEKSFVQAINDSYDTLLQRYREYAR